MDFQDEILEVHDFAEDDVLEDELDDILDEGLDGLLCLGGFTDINLAKWGFLRDPINGELIPATEM